jgi:hypothetical protein
MGGSSRRSHTPRARTLEIKIQGFVFRVNGLGFKDWGSGNIVESLRSKVKVFGLKFCGFGIKCIEWRV